MVTLSDVRGLACAAVERNAPAEWAESAESFIASRGLDAEFLAFRFALLVRVIAERRMAETPVGAALAADEAGELANVETRHDAGLGRYLFGSAVEVQTCPVVEREYSGTIALEWINAERGAQAEPFTTDLGEHGEVRFVAVGADEVLPLAEGLHVHRCTFRYSGTVEVKP
jgi:hypothetical protein